MVASEGVAAPGRTKLPCGNPEPGEAVPGRLLNLSTKPETKAVSVVAPSRPRHEGNQQPDGTEEGMVLSNVASLTLCVVQAQNRPAVHLVCPECRVLASIPMGIHSRFGSGWIHLNPRPGACQAQHGLYIWTGSARSEVSAKPQG